MKKHRFHVNGMHCNACTLLTESEISEISGVRSVKASLSASVVEIEGDFSEADAGALISEINSRLSPHGYAVSLRAQAKKADWSEFKVAIPIAIAVGAFFVLLQRLGIVSLVSAGDVTYGTAFVIGIIASLSSCMAVVGGLVLSMSATFAKNGEKIRPQAMFHMGRIASFVIFGGVIGAIGSAFTLSPAATFIMSLLIGLVMLVLGINLLDVFAWTKKLQPSMPRSLSKRALGVTKLNSTLTPILVGAATFFLPCGFTQSMQLYALSTGGFGAGALTMLSFALGTLPVLALVSMSSLSIRNSKRSGVFFKSAGLIVILFALFNIANSLAAAGLIEPIFNL